MPSLSFQFAVQYVGMRVVSSESIDKDVVDLLTAGYRRSYFRGALGISFCSRS